MAHIRKFAKPEFARTDPSRMGCLATLKVTLLLAAALLSYSCAELREDVQCDQTQRCPQGWTCDASYGLCRVSPPQLELHHPREGVPHVGRTMVLGGRVSDNTAVSELAFRFNNEGPWTGLRLGDGNLFSEEVDAPSVNGEPVPLTFRVVDDFGTESFVTVSVPIDNVRPTVLRVSPAAGTRAASAVLSVEFSEPVQLGPDWLSLTPERERLAAPGAPVTRLDVPLEAATQYDVLIRGSALVDRFGLAGEANVERTFSTPAKAPSGGTRVEFDAWRLLDFDAVSDADGAVTYVAKVRPAAGAELRWGEFDPKSGMALPLSGVPLEEPNVSYQALSAATWLPGTANAIRLTGVTQGASLPGSARFDASVFWRVNAQRVQSQTSNAVGLLPFSAACSDPTAAPFSLISLDAVGQPVFPRADGSTVPLSFVPQRLAWRSPEQWESLEVSNRHLRRQTMSAACGESPRLTVTPDESLAVNLAENAALSVALAYEADSALYVYNHAFNGRTELCERCVYADPQRQSACRESTSAPAQFPTLKVSSRYAGGRILGAHQTSPTTLELVERDLAVTCKSTWSPLGKVTASEEIFGFQPLMFGNVPGVLVQLESALQVLYPEPPTR